MIPLIQRHVIQIVKMMCQLTITFGYHHTTRTTTTTTTTTTIANNNNNNNDMKEMKKTHDSDGSGNSDRYSHSEVVKMIHSLDSNDIHSVDNNHNNNTMMTVQLPDPTIAKAIQVWS
jgi:thiamine kinase-like enzyme